MSRVPLHQWISCPLVRLELVDLERLAAEQPAAKIHFAEVLEAEALPWFEVEGPVALAVELRLALVQVELALLEGLCPRSD